jgi:hypothetical protein
MDFGYAQDFCANGEEEECPQRLNTKLNICGWRMCAFDIDVEAIFLNRVNKAKDIDFTSEEIAGEIVLSSNDFDSGWQTGWRITGEIFFDTCDRIEVSYLSGGNWSSSQSVRSDSDNLYSVLSFFGASPFGGYNGTDEASLHKISYDSEFYTWEVNYRNHVSIFEIPCFCCLDGSLLYGYRYFNLDEGFKLFTQSTANDASMNYKVDTCNSLNGLQIGAEGWIPINECIDFGFEVKGAAYFNSYEQKTEIIAESDLDEPLFEKKDNWGAAWGLEGSVKVCYELSPNFYIRGGYLYLYLDNIALAVENFNKRSPFEDGGRSKKLKNSGSVIYHGATFGIDWCW